MSVWLEVSGLVVGGVSAGCAVYTYWRNSRTKAAEFLLSLHKSFFVDATYAETKKLLDCDGAAEEIRLAEFVRSEAAEFTDFLNFFELVAYLTEIETLKNEDTEALLGYYLDRLQSKQVVWKYIRDSNHGFEYLGRLLAERQMQ